MDLDLDTVLPALYVIVDDLSQRPIRPHLPACGGPPAQMPTVRGAVWVWRPSGAAGCRGTASAA